MKIRKNVIQGARFIILAILCHYAEADTAALLMMICGIALLFGKRKKVKQRWSRSSPDTGSPQTLISKHGIAKTSIS